MKRFHQSFALIALLAGCQSEAPKQVPVLANSGIELGLCSWEDIGLLPPDSGPFLPAEVCRQSVGDVLSSPLTSRNWPTEDGSAAGHHWVEVHRSPVGTLSLDLALDHTLTGVMVDISGRPFFVSEQTIQTFRSGDAGTTAFVSGGQVLAASLDEREHVCYVVEVNGVSGTGDERVELRCTGAVSATQTVDDPVVVLDSQCVPLGTLRLFRSVGDPNGWLIAGEDGVCLRFDDGEWHRRVGATARSPQGIYFRDGPESAADCEHPVARLHPLRRELAASFEAPRGSSAEPASYGLDRSSSDAALSRVCVRGPKLDGVLVANASVFTPGGIELVCGTTCGKPPLMYFAMANRILEYAAWWHALPDGTPMHLGLLLGAFGNNDLVTGVGRVNHKTGVAVWQWPGWLDPALEDLKHAHVALDSNDNVYVGLRHELVAFGNKGQVRWRLPLPNGAKVSALGLSYAGLLWMGLNLPDGTSKVWRVE